MSQVKQLIDDYGELVYVVEGVVIRSDDVAVLARGFVHVLCVFARACVDALRQIDELSGILEQISQQLEGE